MYRDASYWQNPETFDPDRFPVDGPIPNEVTENFNYLPFGGGRRKCIGAALHPHMAHVVDQPCLRDSM
jgi:beta-ring hydroxylase